MPKILLGKVKGDDGKSAYQQVVDKGYTDTEENFIKDLLSIKNKADKSYVDDLVGDLKIIIEDILS